MTDQQCIAKALREAGAILAEYLEPGQVRNPSATLERSIAVLDTQDLAALRERIERGYGLRVEK